MDCVFCKIIAQELPGKFVYEDETVAAIIPIDQVAQGHTLVIPKRHYQDIFDIDEGVLRDLAVVTKALAKQLAKENSATGINLVNANGKDAQQSVFHFHMHIIPRHPDDGLDMWMKQGL